MVNILIMHYRREIQSLEIHRMIAAKMCLDPSGVINKAVSNLHGWLEHQQGSAMEVVLREWLEILVNVSPGEIADFLVSESERATRMRQSSPFAGVLSPGEVWAIKRGRHETA